MMQRLDSKSARYYFMGRAVLIAGRGVTLEISHEALEVMTNRQLGPDEAVQAVLNELKRFTRLAEFVPADDGKIHITTGILLSDGVFDHCNGGK